MNHDTLHIIKSRRSVRKYLPSQIDEEKLGLILEAGLYAPSGGNGQPWHFLVIQDKSLLDEINIKTKEIMAKASIERVAKAGNSHAYHVFHNAPTVVIVSGHKDAKSPIAIPGENWSYTPLADCSAAIQNMLIAAESLGIGSCWIGYIEYYFALEEEVAKLNIPSDFKPLFAVSLGYKDPVLASVVSPERKGDKISWLR